jgi:hypothetical protein
LTKVVELAQVLAVIHLLGATLLLALEALGAFQEDLGGALGLTLILRIYLEASLVGDAEVVVAREILSKDRKKF